MSPFPLTFDGLPEKNQYEVVKQTQLVMPGVHVLGLPVAGKLSERLVIAKRVFAVVLLHIDSVFTHLLYVADNSNNNTYNSCSI